jgi:hypothetical protein
VRGRRKAWIGLNVTNLKRKNLPIKNYHKMGK